MSKALRFFGVVFSLWEVGNKTGLAAVSAAVCYCFFWCQLLLFFLCSLLLFLVFCCFRVWLWCSFGVPYWPCFRIEWGRIEWGSLMMFLGYWYRFLFDRGLCVSGEGWAFWPGWEPWLEFPFRGWYFCCFGYFSVLLALVCLIFFFAYAN